MLFASEVISEDFVLGSIVSFRPACCFGTDGLAKDVWSSEFVS